MPELDTWALLIGAGNYDRARSILAALGDSMDTWLRPDHEATAPSLCAVRKIHRLITPGEQEVCTP